jgi:DMSO/TMAO reductase YedYZ molybdopterin-dependent catalytic subunit
MTSAIARVPGAASVRALPDWIKRSMRRELPAFTAGVAASMAATLLMLLLRLVAGVITLPELLAERLLPQINIDLFLAILVLGKLPPLGLALAGQIVLGVLLAPLYAQLLRRWAGSSQGRWPALREWLTGGALALGLWLIAVALFWPKLGENLEGLPLDTARGATTLALAAIFALYGSVLVIVYYVLRAPQSAAAERAARAREPDGLVRRDLLRRSASVAVGALAAGGLGIGGALGALLSRSTIGYDGATTAPSVGGTVAAITPTAQFYTVTKNVIDPLPALTRWELEVTGLVAHPGRYDLASLQALAQQQRTITLECVSNPVGGRLISTAVWRGVLLETVLGDRGGALPAASHVVFTSVDGYQSSQPLADLLDVRTLLAWEMNGAALPTRHGYPLRVVIPNYFGEHSPKWLTRIDVLDYDVLGFYQSQGWSWGPLPTMSRIDTPSPGAQLAQSLVHVAGIAYAGNRGIQAVDVSLDGGTTWQAATLAPASSTESWVLWSLDWRPAYPGAYTVVARATDGTGELQGATRRGIAPSGATGYHSVQVTVA